jgi:prophage tail gpP-like protein
MELKISDRYDNRVIKYFNEVNVQLKHDAVASTFAFVFNFNPNNPDHKELSCVSHYHDVEIFHNGKKLITGILLSQSFKQNAKGIETQFSGYSTSGQLEDCQIPPNIYPLQSNGLSLKNIASKIGNAFKPKIGVIVDELTASSASGSFKTSAPEATTTCKSYLQKLATQKDIILSNDPSGKLLLTKSNTNGKPILDIDLTDPKKSIPVVQAEMLFPGQPIHSHITAMRQAGIDSKNAGQQTLRNPYVIGSVHRPKVISQSSGDDNSTYDTVRRALGDEIRNIKVKLKLDRWTIDNKLIFPNNTIRIHAPGIYIWYPSIFFIESVSYLGNEKQQSTELICTLPEAYNDERNIVNIFRDINIHPRV